MNTSDLKTGDKHYRAYVGPPAHYDFMGATQFRLLCTLGLRENQSLLDVGCGSLRAGRLFITYLDSGKYFGIEPNKWLVEEAVQNHLGNDLLNIKKPSFDYNAEFETRVFPNKFDFIVAQSIFSHTGEDLVRIAFENFKHALEDDGILVITFIEGLKSFDGKGWIYPGCVRFTRSKIKRFAAEAGFVIARIPWYHPRQRWYVLANTRERLPKKSMMRYLQGAVLFDPDFSASRSSCKKFIHNTRNLLNLGRFLRK